MPQKQTSKSQSTEKSSFLGLSLRQLACFAAAAVLAIATCFVCLHWLRMDMQVVSYIVMVEVLPFLGLGFIHRDGYPFEKLVKIYWAWHSENAAMPIRPYKESRNVQKEKELAEIPNVKPIAAETKKQRAKEGKQRSKQLRRSAKQSEMNAAQSARSIKKCRAPEKAADCLQYERMYESGICEVEPGLFSMTMAFTDVNFQLARQEEQKSLFTQYSEFLNYFDPDTHLQISLVTRRVDEAEFRRDTFLPLRGDARDRYSEGNEPRYIGKKRCKGKMD